MTYLSVRIDPAAVLASVDIHSKTAILSTIAAKAADAYGLDAAKLHESLMHRETLGSTGFGDGVAIPHARVAGLDRCSGLFVTLAQSIDFDAHDGQPVDMLFCLLSPEQGSADHLKALAEISRFLRDSGNLAKLRGAEGKDAIFALLTGHQDQQAA